MIHSSFFKSAASLGTRFLRTLPPETAHNLAGFALSQGLVPFQVRTNHLLKKVDLSCSLGEKIQLPHPLGLAAGFDKNACFLPGLSRLGFGFLEVGAATPLAQEGHPQPRIFRYPDKKALVNRMGFNNIGVELINKNLKKFLKENKKCVLGLNVGVNKNTPVENALDDYIHVLKNTTDQLKYYSLNLSSPNTASLKHLCHPDLVKKLSERILEETDVPLGKVWIKLGPNLEEGFFKALVKSVHDQAFAGLILTNTFPVEEPEKGGLSGPPLVEMSEKALEWAYEVHEGALPMIAVGGISSGRDLYRRIERGAHLAQIYTAFIYQGPYVVENILKEFVDLMQKNNILSLHELRGSYYS